MTDRDKSSPSLRSWIAASFQFRINATSLGLGVTHVCPVFISALRSARSRLAGALGSTVAILSMALASPAVHAASATVIESSGATSLVLADNTYHFGSATGPQLRYNGSAVVVGQFGNASPIAVEQKGSGYQIAWKVSGAVQFNVWNTDISGNFQSYTPLVSGSSAALKSFETSFNQDLNGDGVIGVAATGAVSGVCGSANGTTVASKPPANLCTAGTVSSVAGTGPW